MTARAGDAAAVEPRGPAGWEHDYALTSTGVVLPVRATAVRPSWSRLPSPVRSLVESAAGSSVVGAWSAGTGFTPGFASRLDLADGTSVFVKAASSADGEDGWLAGAYREEARKLTRLPSGIGAPRLVWHRDVELASRRWVVLGLQYVDGTPPRRPWQRQQLRRVLDKLAATAPALAHAPADLELGTVVDEIVKTLPSRLAELEALEHGAPFLREVKRLSSQGERWLAGDCIVHLDLRDDNILIDRAGEVWFVDWNWPALGAPWIDLVCLLISVAGDGIDADSALADHSVSRDVDPEAIDCLLALLWSFWEVGRHRAVPETSPHLRNHQMWYADATAAWLSARLRSRGISTR